MICTEKSLHNHKKKMCKPKVSYQKYTDEFRIAVVKEYLAGGISKHALSKKYSIPQQCTVSNWIRKFVGEENEEVPMKKNESPRTESEEINRLKRELKKSKLALYQERMRADAYDTMIDVAEEMFKIPIRKKAGTKQSYYQHHEIDFERLVFKGFILEYVHDIRLKAPRIGYQKLFEMCKSYFGEKFTMGRDAFYNLLRESGLMLRIKRRKARTTYSDPYAPFYPNQIKGLIPTAANQVWVSDILAKNGMQASRTEHGDPLENAVAERGNGIFKQEWLSLYSFENEDEIRKVLIPAIEFYNKERPHASNNRLTPEQAYKQDKELKRMWKNYPYTKTHISVYQ